MKLKIEVQGLAQLERALLQFEKQSTQKAIMSRSLVKAAEPMAEAARARAPVARGVLKASIKIGTKTVGEAGNRAFHAAMRQASKADHASGAARAGALVAMRGARRAAKASGEVPMVVAYMGTTAGANHGIFAEFGTSPHINQGKFAGSHHPGTPPHPFMRPAFDAQAQPTVDRLAVILAQEIDKAARRAAARARKA
jgi:HK97 gp10 family phage protein